MIKVSASKTVFMPINSVGKNYLPFVEDLRDRTIKYIDIVPMATIPYNASGVGFQSMDGYITIADKIGNGYPYKGLPLQRFNPLDNRGQRPYIGREISLQNSYIEINDLNDVGKTAVLVFYYDLNAFSALSSSFSLNYDNVETMITASQNKNIMPDLRALAGQRFRHISWSAPVTTIAGNTGVTQSEALNIYVSFYKGNYAIIDLLPLPLLYDIALLESIDLANIEFDLTNSFVIVGGQVNLDGKAVLLNVDYEHKD